MAAMHYHLQYLGLDVVSAYFFVANSDMDNCQADRSQDLDTNKQTVISPPILSLACSVTLSFVQQQIYILVRRHQRNAHSMFIGKWF